MDLQIEARSLLDIIQTLILPAAMEDVGANRNSGFTSKTLGKKENIVQELLDETDKLSEAFENFPDKDAASTALYAQETIKPLMDSVRTMADSLEGMVDRRLWPFPTYSELLHEHA